MKKDNAIAMAILCILLAMQPFLYDGFGSAISIIPIIGFALVMLYFALRTKPLEFKEDPVEEPAATADAKTKKHPRSGRD